MKQFITDFFQPNTSASEMAWQLVNLLHVKITRTTLKREIEEHPFYPSVLSMSDVLSNYGVKNLTARFDVNKIADITPPFIVQIKGSPSNFFSVVSDIDGNVIRFHDVESKKWIRKDRKHFTEKCTGIVLLTEIGKHSGEKNYLEETHREKYALYIRYFGIFALPIILVLEVLYGFIIYGSAILLPFIFSLLILIGCYICSLILWYEVDKSSHVLQQICSSGGKNNCGAVLNSRGSKIFGVSWSKIGFSYYCGILICLLVSGIYNFHIFNVISWLNLCTVPYVFYSIFYQWRISRQWCTLCLSTQVVIVLSCLISLISGWNSGISFEPAVLIRFIAAFVISFIVSTLLTSLIHQEKVGRENRIDFQRLKHRADIFDVLLKKQKEVTEKVDGLGILLGNPNASNKIIKVCNPYCGPCARAHAVIEELLANHDDLSIQIIFTATNSDDDKRSLPVKHFLAIYERGDEELTKQVLNEWYMSDKKDYELFALKYPIKDQMSEQESKIEAMRSWCNKIGVSSTPTFFFNGYLLPNVFNIADLKYFIYT